MKRNTLAILSKCFHTTWKVSRNPLNVRKKFADRIGVLPMISVDNGSSHRGETAERRLRQIDARIIFADLDAIRLRLAWYEELSNQRPTPFQWKFDRAKLLALLAKIEAYQQFLSSPTPNSTPQRRQHNLNIIYETEH